MHLNDVLAHIFFFIYCVLQCCTYKIFFSCISTSRFSYVQRFFSKMKLVKTSLHIQLKQINLENWLHTFTESSKEGFNDTVFQHFVYEIKHCNLDMRMYLQLSPVFLCLYSISLLYYLLEWSFFIMCFALLIFYVNLQYFSPLLQDPFVIFNENLLQSRNEQGENRCHKETRK